MKVIFTKEIYSQGLSNNGSFNNHQLKIMGIYPNNILHKMFGELFEEDQITEFIKYKNYHLDGRLRNNKGIDI